METKRKILVVDDNKDLVEVVKLTLETYGFDCFDPGLFGQTRA